MSSSVSSLSIAWVILCAALVFVMQAGFLCLESGLTRTKNSINVAVKNVTDFGVSVIFFWAIGFGLMFGNSIHGGIGSDLFFVQLSSSNPWLATFFVFQAMFCGTAVTIVSGAVAERMSFFGYLSISVLVALLIYPVFGHWAWGGTYAGEPGWLANLGFIDFAGSSVVHSVGGWVSLVAVILIGPRNGRFLADGTVRDIQGQHLPMAMLGALLLFLGWIGFNGGSTLEMNAAVPNVVANTVIGGVAGLCFMLVVGWIWKGYPNPKHPINGLIAGLVAVTANCHIIDTWQAVVIGGIAGVIALVLERVLEILKIDDVVGAFPVHTGAGIWGTLAVALFGRLSAFGEGVTRWDQFQIQLLGVTVCFVISVVPTALFILGFRRWWPFRVSAEAEHQGLNAAEHRASTEYLDLLIDMEAQAQASDLTKRVRVEPFTEVGQIASKYNEILDSLQLTMARDEMLVRDTRDGVISCTIDGHILSANPGAEKMFGFSECELAQKEIWNLIEGIQKPDNLGRDTFSIEKVKSIEIKGIRSSGEKFPLDIESSLRKVSDRTVITLKIHDITQRVLHHQQLTLAKENAENARDELKEKIGEIEAFNKIAVDREIRMTELKEMINSLSLELGKEPPFQFNKDALLKRSRD